jgi:predicted enzyme related to lactoylglutathione lyase
MPERDGYIPGVPCWVDTSQPDPEAASRFYGELFGWELEDVMPPEAPGNYFMARIRGGDVAAIGPVPEGAPPIAMWNTYIQVDSADQAASQVRDAGGNVMMEPFDVMGAGRMAVFTDPEGAMFCVWEPKEHKGARVVNEHGSVNFNTLNTRDVESAKAFYGSVFGWGTLDLGGGDDMWTLRAYGDHLEEMTPGLRKSMGEMGAPEGFADVVAGIQRIPDDQQDTPAHWSVTFAVDDADAIAAKAEETGGKVVVPPFDAPWVRAAVLADPAGATFIASKFVPENKDMEAPANPAVEAG